MTETTVESSDDRARIRATIDTYLQWCRTGDPNALNEAFHPDATIVNASNGDDNIVPWTIADFAKGVDSLRTSRGTVEETAHDVTIDLAGNVACARVEFELHIGHEYHQGTDLLVLVRLGDHWRIIHKAYDSSRPYNGPPT